MKTETQRINNIIGQLEGIKKMIEDEKDYVQVLTQLKAVRSALKSFSSQYLAARFASFMSECAANEQEGACSKFVSELLNE